MRFHPWADFLKSTSPRRRPPRPPMQCPRRQPARARLSLEELEQRTLLSGTPTPIPASINPGLGGPDIHLQLPGPANNTTGIHGGEPSTINNFAGLVGVAHVQGTGTSNSGTTQFWDSDMRLMRGIYQASDGSIQHGTFAEI